MGPGLTVIGGEVTTRKQARSASSYELLWSMFLRPHRSVTDQHQRRVLALVAFWNLVSSPLGPLLGALQVMAGEGHRVSVIWVLIAPLASLCNYLLLRSRFGWLALWLQVVTTLGLVGGAMWVSPDRAATSVALVIPVLAAALSFGLRQVLLVQAATISMLLVYGSQLPGDQLGRYIGSGTVLMASFIIIAAIVRLRELEVAVRLQSVRADAARARALLAAGFDGTADVVDGRLVNVSVGFSRALGCAVGDLDGRRVDHAFALSRSGDDHRDDAVPFLDGAGSLRYLSILREVLPGEAGIDEVIAVRDQTHEQLHRANLQFSDRMVAVGTLASGVAHEINNALTTLSGHSELGPIALQRGDLQRASRSFQAIEDASERIAVCVRQLSRFGTREESETRSISLNDVVESTIRLAQHRLRHVAQLKVELAEALPVCRAAEASVGQIVMNLLLNAADAVADVPNPRILARTAVEGPWVTIRIIDNGPGIPEQLRDRIFQPFFTSRGKSGSGLGLSISVSLADGMGGTLRLEPSESGATFCLRLPVSDAVSDIVERPAVVHAVRSTDRIMVLDDERDVLAVVKDLLAPAVVTAVASVAEAKSVWSDDFDMVISDVIMPTETGLDFRRWVAENHPDALGRFVLMTGSAVGLENEMKSLGPEQRVLEKPIRRADLLELLWSVRR